MVAMWLPGLPEAPGQVVWARWIQGVGGAVATSSGGRRRKNGRSAETGIGRIFNAVWVSIGQLFSRIILFVICGVVQWLGRRSLAGGLSLIYVRSMVDIWLLRE